MEVEIQTHPVESRQELSPKLMDVPETNGQEKVPKTPEGKRSARSRSRTPKRHSKRKNNKDTAAKEVEEKPQNGSKSDGKSEAKIAIVDVILHENENLNGNIEAELKQKAKDLPKKAEDGSEVVEMDPLVLNADEPDPELVFDDNSDLESANNSPAPSRCKTRRSQTRSIPTPKTPRAVDIEIDTDPKTVPSTPDGKSTPINSPQVLDHTYDSIDVNVSTCAEAGNDSTRLEFNDTTEDHSYLEGYKNRSLRGLSARRSIRAADDYLKQALRNNRGKADLNLKRKFNGDESPEAKRAKTDSSSSLLSLLASPFSSIRNRFGSDVASSTPKLTGYKDENGTSYADNQIEIENDAQGKKGWCSLM